ncbi:MAG: 4Fe-4S dicluster domain-containing protein [Firmicutes bacterium]|nr:4Fe-4S dicluster domain-containing protein [Bacillota bacterium]
MDKYFHSVVLDKSNCNGCTNCMRRCPTEAIRIRDKKAMIIQERCIDCGECIKVCPYHAQNVLTDDLDKLNDYKFNIAIPSVTMHGQFTQSTNMNRIFQGIKKLGFDYIYDEGIAADIVTYIIKEKIKENDLPKPIISTLCPAVVRLIQLNFPSLLDNIMKVESPMEVAARLAKEKVIKKFNLSPEEVGVFYLTPCPAKVTSTVRPVGLEHSYVDGVISIKKVYGDIVRNEKTISKEEEFEMGSPLGRGWARVGGQSHALGLNNYVAVDGIENVIKVLEEIELGKLDNIDYFEGLACFGGCVGGPLNVENPFIAKSRVRKLSEGDKTLELKDIDIAMDMYKKGVLTLTKKIEPKSVMKLDSDIKKAMNMVEEIKKINKKLPGLDCGSCGAPNCYALAEDIVNGFAKIENCIFRLNDEK